MFFQTFGTAKKELFLCNLTQSPSKGKTNPGGRVSTIVGR